MDKVQVKRALISVTDKTGVAEFAKTLADEFGIEVVSTGGTARVIAEAGVDVRPIDDLTGFPEMMGGRVKTLHPKVHGGLLADRSKSEHMDQAEEHGIGLIDMVVVNLYAFEQTVAKPDVKLEEAIENIDIGGPSMLRSAAKNFASVTHRRRRFSLAIARLLALSLTPILRHSSRRSCCSDLAAAQSRDSPSP